MKNRFRGGVLSLLLLSSFIDAGAALSTPAVDEVLTAPGALTAWAHGLQSPDGLAIHPTTREVYVAEEAAGRISVLRDGKAAPVITEGFEVSDELPPWAVTLQRPASYWRNPVLRNPEGISFSPEGHLFVAEDAPDGRILEFIPSADGRYQKARAVPVPWSQDGYGWEGVLCASDGRIFISGSAAESGPGVFYGVVLMRDGSGDWWVVDYGPFASFTGMALSADERVLVVGEEVGGSVSWWDTLRHEEMGYTAEVLPRVESVAVLPDGSIVALQESTRPLGAALAAGGPPRDDARIVRIHPGTGAITEIAAGLPPLEGVVYDAENGRLWISEDVAGRVSSLDLRIAPGSDDLLARSLHTRELARGCGPKKWPEFLKSFFLNLGIDPVDNPGPPAAAKTLPSLPEASELLPKTLEEFSEQVPFVAGRIKVVKPVGPVGKDPLDELSFVLFYPSTTVKSSSLSTPSLSLFSARHQSGQVIRTRELAGFSATSFRAGESTASAAPSSPATLLLPLGNGSVQNRRGETRISLSFLGVEFLDDYLVALNVGDRESGHLTLRMRQGGREQYDVTFVEKDAEGRIHRNLVVAGLDKSGANNYGWYKIGSAGAPTLLTMSPNEMPFHTRRTDELVRTIQAHQREWKVAMGLQEETPFSVASVPNASSLPLSYVPGATAVGRPDAMSRAEETASREPVELRPRQGGRDQQVDRQSPREKRADAPDGDRRAEKEGERRVESPEGDRQASSPAPGDIPVAKPGAPPPAKPDAVILSRALKAWQGDGLK